MNARDTKRAGGNYYPGTWLSIGSPVIAELASECGLAWVLLDLEHGCATESELPDQLRALRGSRTRSVVRMVPGAVNGIGRILDWGAEGIMAPHVKDAKQVEAILKAMCYPPEGQRGVSRTVRAYGYGIREFNTDYKPLLFAQIETLQGVLNARSIAEVPGVDVLFVGPADLQHDLRHVKSEDKLSFDICVELVAQAARDTGKQSGILLRDASLLSRYIGLGFQWLAVQSDLGILRQAFQETLQTFNNLS